MAEPTADAPAPTSAAGEAAGAAPQAEAATAAQMIERGELNIRELVEAGVHFGHQTRRWNPRMKSFLFGERNGVHIVDLDQTLPRFRDALDFLRETVAGGGRVLFVATKRQAQDPVEIEAKRAGQFYVNRRWLGGMLTNFKTVKKSIDRYKGLLELVGDEERVGELSKKELSRVNRWIEKYRKSLDGIIEMTRLPDAIFVIDVAREAIAVKEGRRLGIPIVGIVDSNCNPDHVDFVVPGNDDSIRALQLYCGRVADACMEGSFLFNERVQSQVSEEEMAKAAGGSAEKTSTGRVVVEIKQQPRRGRGAQSSGGRRDEPGTPAAPTAPAVAAAEEKPEAAPPLASGPAPTTE
jgi:small subunit ribosomal protein S2